MAVLPLFWRQHLGDVGYARDMSIDAGKQHGACRCTVCRGVVISEAQSLLRQRIQGGRADFAAIRSQVAEAKVIGEHQQYVGTIGRDLLLCYYLGGTGIRILSR